MEEGNSALLDCVPRALLALRRADMRERTLTNSVYLPRSRPWKASCHRGPTTSLAWQTLLGPSMDKG